MHADGATTNAVLDLLDALYEAPFDPRWWGRVGQLLVPLFDADCALVLTADREDGRVEFALAEGTDDHAAHAFADFVRRAEGGPGAGGRRARLTPPGTDTGIYHDLWRHDGRPYFTLAGASALDERAWVGIGLPRERRRGPYLSQAMGLLDRLTPHVSRALRMTRQNARACFVETVAELAAGVPSAAAFALDDRAQLVFVNPRGEQLLATSDGLTVRGGRLVAAVAAGQAGLEAAFARALAPPDPASADEARHAELTLDRPRARSPLRLTLQPAPVRLMHWLGRHARGAVVIAHVPQAPARVTVDAVMKVLPLTQAEARVVAELVVGHGTREIAAVFRVSVETVRAQIKSAMRRLECHSQSQLTGKVLAALGRKVR